MKKTVCSSHHIIGAKEQLNCFFNKFSKTYQSINSKNRGKAASLTCLGHRGSHHCSYLPPSIRSSSLRSCESPLMFKCIWVYVDTYAFVHLGRSRPPLSCPSCHPSLGSSPGGATLFSLLHQRLRWCSSMDQPRTISPQVPVPLVRNQSSLLGPSQTCYKGEDCCSQMLINCNVNVLNTPTAFLASLAPVILLLRLCILSFSIKPCLFFLPAQSNLLQKAWNNVRTHVMYPSFNSLISMI